MKEQIDVRGNKVLVLIEPHPIHHREEGQQTEYFTASYTVDNPTTEPGVVLLLEADNSPKRFVSPVQALEYAGEKLLGLI
jgi:hypothetical protein